MHCHRNTVTQVAAVSEPSTWVMLLFGFGGLGFIVYRRKPKLAAMARLRAAPGNYGHSAFNSRTEAGAIMLRV
ncbi:PEP-CTERM sorting domain-containing protein [Bradyrhizobium campsiandrae]|uniref:PEP-CTERM sorting domain-containing protein n=1 Tax=Bradyrhizobium campsiandrae TaxID=1729892 RepID=UPI0035DAE726